MACEKICTIINRRKRLRGDVMDTSLNRCLTTLDLALLGIGHMIGAGIYVVTGTIARNMAGPATFLSYIISGIAAIFSALCFIEFGSQVPKAGSSYIYTYLTMGEIWAFMAGWNMILESGLGVASVARSFGGTVDAMGGGRVTYLMQQHVGTVPLGSHAEPPDFIAFGIVVIVTIVVAIGAKCSARLNNVLTTLSIATIIFLIVVGFSQADSASWKDAPGGFLPHGMSGVFQGAAISLFAYVGFDAIATGSEEAANPRRSLPISTLVAMSVAMLIYILASLSLSLMVPYNQIHTVAPFSYAFADNGLTWTYYIVSFGSFCSLSTSLLANMFALPRSIYAMAEDGLLFRCLAYVHPVTQTPLVAISIFGGSVALLALVTDMGTLVEVMSIGSLLAYTFVAISILILRFEPLTFSPRHDVKSNFPGDNVAKEEIPLVEASISCGLLRSCVKEIPWLRASIYFNCTRWQISLYNTQDILRFSEGNSRYGIESELSLNKVWW